MAQPNTPFIYSAANSASYGRTIAQGSIFTVSGANIGPAQLIQANSNPLPIQLGGTAITVTSGPTTVSCPMMYSVTSAASAVLPSNVPPGRAMVTLTYNGQSTPFPFPVNVVPSSVGIYTLGSSGLGLGVFTAADGSAKTFAVTARNSETVTAWATGLGPVSGPANAVPSTFPNFPGVEVFVGTLPAKVIYAGRSGCCVGLDQISFEVPAGVAGCYVPVAVRSGGTLGNFVSIAVNSAGGPCSDTAPTIPVSLMNQAIAGQPVKAVALAAGPVSVLQGLGFNEKLYLAGKLSKLLHVKVSEQDVAKLLLAEQTHNRRALMRAMTKYAASWKALNPASKAAVQAALNPNQEGAVAAFGQFSTPGALAAAVGGLFPSQGTCAVPALSFERTARGLDAGSSLAVSGQAGAGTLTPSRTGQYQALFGGAPSGPNLPPGTYTIMGGGGRDVSAFSATLNVGGNVLWTNKAAISTIDRSQPLTVTWSGGTNPGYVLVGGWGGGFFTSGLAGFVCVEDISKGSFTIPSFILSALPPGGGGMFISPHPLSRQVTIPGVDLAYFMDGSSDAKSVIYQVAGLQIVSGNNQSAGPNQFFAPLTVQAVDTQRNPLSNVPITWSVSAGSASLLNRLSSTNASGQASVNVVAGPSPGAVSISAATGSLAAQFALTITSGLTSGVACADYQLGFVPFTSVAYRSAPNSAGDTLIVGAVPLANLPMILNLPLPSAPNQEFCGAVNLGGGYNVMAYVPTAAERAGNFNAFGAALIDPITNLPFPGNIIPESRLGQTYAWRIPAQSISLFSSNVAAR